ncbi:hypothetical protein [Verminephrobacter eiseniae]|uniref:hypothetical protein n=1 Tax=Verminephrobacter eiseniae TaxID=364317 RepID=UPI002237888D|nr:hypothetical protein [Verminephrobacter eiseniae]
MPLTPDVFKQPGGALQCGLQAGLLAVRASDATIFLPKATAQERQKNDPIFRWLAYCAALASTYLICLGQVEVVLDGGETFSFASHVPLSQAGKGFTANWKASPSGVNEAGLIYLQSFFYSGQFAHLEPPSMVAALGGAINPLLAATPHESPLGRVVRTSLALVIEAQRQREAASIADAEPVAMGDVPVQGKAVASARLAQADALRPAQAPASEVQAAVAAPAVALRTSQAATKQAPLTINSKVVEWAQALALIESMDGEITVDDKGIRLSRKALGFGATPKENYTALYEAGVVIEKGADFALCNRALADVYAQAKKKVSKA